MPTYGLAPTCLTWLTLNKYLVTYACIILLCMLIVNYNQFASHVLCYSLFIYMCHLFGLSSSYSRIVFRGHYRTALLNNSACIIVMTRKLIVAKFFGTYLLVVLIYCYYKVPIHMYHLNYLSILYVRIVVSHRYYQLILMNTTSIVAYKSLKSLCKKICRQCTVLC
jgi:hypothetical protein